MEPEESPERAASREVRSSVAERYVRWTVLPMLGGVVLSLTTLIVSQAQWYVYLPTLVWLVTVISAALLGWKKLWLKAAAWMCAGMLTVTTSAVAAGGVQGLAFVGNTVLLALVVPLYGARVGLFVLGWTLAVGAAWLAMFELGHASQYPAASPLQSYIFSSVILIVALPVLIAPSRMLNQALKQARQRLDEMRRAQAQERAAAQALQDASEQLEQARRLEALGRLSAGVAHDFNNMLVAIHGAADLAADSLKKGALQETADNLALLDEAAERAARLTAQLLAFGRRGQFETRQVDVCAVARSVSKLSRSSLGASVKLRLALPPEELWVDGDRVALEQALLNLVLNARDSMKGRGTILVHARLASVEAEWCEASTYDPLPGNVVQLTVQDDGPGIPEEVRDKMFEPFFTTKSEGVGTGLGLAAVHGTVISHRGMIHVESILGEGTAFQILLPAGAAPTAELAPDSATSRSSSTAPPGGLVMVADDDPLSRRAVSATLQRIGYEAVSCASAEEVLEKLDSTQGCVAVVSDVVMPGITGVALVGLLADKSPELPVVLMSGFVPESELSGTAQASSVLRKPFSRKELSRALSSAIAGNRKAG